MARFEIQPSRDNQFYFVLKAPNGKVILTSEIYESVAGCEKGILSVINHSQYERYFQRLEAVSGQLYFVLKAENGEVIGTSEMYESDKGRTSGIESVMKNAGRAEVKRY